MQPPLKAARVPTLYAAPQRPDSRGRFGVNSERKGRENDLAVDVTGDRSGAVLVISLRGRGKPIKLTTPK